MIRDLWEFPERRIGNRVVVYSTTDSTNTRAAEHSGQDGLAFLADAQTAGRGQHGRTWLARPGASVLLSVLVKPPRTLARPVVLTAWTAVCVAEVVIRLSGLTPRIKWPNDIYVEGRKIAGILIEQGRNGEVVAGIGFNVKQTLGELAEAGLLLATSLHALGHELETEQVARLLLEQLDKEYGELLAGNTASLEQRWRRHLSLVSRWCRLETAEGMIFGRIRELAFDGVIIHHGERMDHLIPEAIRHMTEFAEDSTF